MAHERRIRLAALGIASAGVMISHWLTYLLHVPAADHRSGVLAATGHGYQPFLGQAVAVLLAVSIAALFLGRAILAHPVSDRSLAVRLAGVQVGTFAGMEVVERLVAGVGLADLTSGGLLPLGVGLNVAVALLGAVLLRCVLRLAERVAGIAGRGPVLAQRDAVLGLPAQGAAARLPRDAFTILPARAPPSPVLG